MLRVASSDSGRLIPVDDVAGEIQRLLSLLSLASAVVVRLLSSLPEAVRSLLESRLDLPILLRGLIETRRGSGLVAIGLVAQTFLQLLLRVVGASLQLIVLDGLIGFACALRGIAILIVLQIAKLVLQIVDLVSYLLALPVDLIHTLLRIRHIRILRKLRGLILYRALLIGSLLGRVLGLAQLSGWIAALLAALTGLLLAVLLLAATLATLALISQSLLRVGNCVCELLTRLLLTLLRSAPSLLANVIRCPLQLLGGLLQFGIVILTGQPIELTRQILRLPLELLRIGATLTALSVLALDPLSQLRQAVLGFLFLRCQLLLAAALAALRSFVLIASLIEFEFEQVRQILRILLTALATTLLPAALALLTTLLAALRLHFNLDLGE